MLDFIEYLLLFMMLVVFFQMYFFAISCTGVEKQNRCQNFGIVFTSIGIVCLIFHQIQLVTGGLILMMLGFKLIAHGLDRIDKKIFITRYNDDNHPPTP